MESRARRRLISIFETTYPNPASELHFSGEFQLIVAVILSAQSTDKKVNELTPALFRRFPSFDSLSRAGISSVESLIRPVNYYKTKARNLIAMATVVQRDFGGHLPRSREELMQLPGVGPKTANVVTVEAGMGHAFPVDTHVFRVARRLGLASGATPPAVETEIMEQFKPQQWRNLHHWLILHGRRVCTARGPRCSECPLARLCPSAGKIEGAK